MTETLAEKLETLAEAYSLYQRSGVTLKPEIVCNLVRLLNIACGEARILKARKCRVTQEHLCVGGNVVVLEDTLPMTLAEDLTWLVEWFAFFQDSGTELRPETVRSIVYILSTASKDARRLETRRQKLTQKHLRNSNVVLWPLASRQQSKSSARKAAKPVTAPRRGVKAHGEVGQDQCRGTGPVNEE